MSEISQMCKCIDREDKKLMLRIVDEAISRESSEIKKIEARRMHNLMKPSFVESFLGISSSLVRIRKDFMKDMENLKKRVEEYSLCTTTTKPTITEIGYNVPRPQADMPIPYSQRKLK